MSSILEVSAGALSIESDYAAVDESQWVRSFLWTSYCYSGRSCFDHFDSFSKGN